MAGLVSRPLGLHFQSASVMLKPAWSKASKGIITWVHRIQIGNVSEDALRMFPTCRAFNNLWTSS